MNTVKQDTDRYHMWSVLIPGYSGMGRRQKKNAKINYADERNMMPHEITLDSCNPTITKEVYHFPSLRLAPYKKENNMGYYDPKSPTELETEQRNHLKRRLESVYSDLYNKIGDKFGISEPKGPRTKDELLDALKNGKFTVRDCFFTDDGRLNEFDKASSAISWRTTPFDTAGYNAAMDALEKSYVETKDKILILPVVDGLKALQEFEAYTV